MIWGLSIMFEWNIETIEKNGNYIHIFAWSPPAVLTLLAGQFETVSFEKITFYVQQNIQSKIETCIDIKYGLTYPSGPVHIYKPSWKVTYQQKLTFFSSFSDRRRTCLGYMCIGSDPSIPILLSTVTNTSRHASRHFNFLNGRL